MSLVNDMLRDLEAGKREPLPQGVVPGDQQAAQSTHNQQRMLLGIAAVLLPATFYFGLNWQSETARVERAHSIAPVPPPEVPLAQPPAADLQTSPDSVASEERTVVVHNEPLALDPAREEQTARLRHLLRDADAALQANRLTTPIADNAFSRYQAVLLLDPAQPEALRGIANIAERYAGFYGQAMIAGDKTSATRYRKNAELVVSRYPPLKAALNQRLADLDSKLALMHPSDSAPAVPDADLAQVEPAVTAESDPAPPSQAVRVVRADQDQRIAGQAQTLIGKARFAQAESLLLSHLQDFPESDASRTTLIELYLRKENSEAARRQLDQLAKIPAHQRAQLRARIEVLDGELEAALNALESASPGISEAPEFHAYQAALYHRAARYRQAADLYEQLLAFRDNDATYWLGLAVSLDALKDKDGALRAFHHARLYTPADAPSRAYVEERIRTLSS